MSQPSSPASGGDGKSVSRADSFTKFIRSPLRSNSNSPKSGKKSSNSLTKLLFGRKSSKSMKGRGDEGEGSNISPTYGEHDEEENDAPNLIEEVKEVVETAADNVVHRGKQLQTSVDQTTDAAISTGDELSTEAKEVKQSLLEKFKEASEVVDHVNEHKHEFLESFKKGFGKAKEGLIEDFDKTKDELLTILHKKPSVEKKPSADLSLDKKPSVEEVIKTPPNLAERLKEEEVVAIDDNVDDDIKKGEKVHEEIKEIGVKKKEDGGCVSSLAEGLQKMCAPWSSKKEV